MSNNNSLQERFLFFRTQILRMSQTEMAGILGLSPSAIGRWENTENRSSEPSGRVLWQLVKSFQLNPDWLFEGSGHPQLTKTTVSNNQTSGETHPKIIWQAEPLRIGLDQVNEVGEEVKSIHAAIENLRLKLNAD